MKGREKRGQSGKCLKILGVFYSQRFTLFTSSNHGLRGKGENTQKKAGRKRSAFEV